MLDELKENPECTSPENASTSAAPSFTIRPETLGSQGFRRDYNLQYAYVAGAMYKGIASKELVIAMGQAGLLGFYGTGGLRLEQVEKDILHIKSKLQADQSYGMNLLASLDDPGLEQRTVELFLKSGVKNIEAAAYMQMTPSLVRYRLTGVTQKNDGVIHIPNKIIAKVSHPDVAELFMRPAPANTVAKLVAAGYLTPQEAELSQNIPMAHDICVEADSGGHTDQGVAYVLMPAMIVLRDRIMAEQKYADAIRVGAAGGIGTPDAAAAAFILGADFILTGSINQCTVEAGTSDAAKDILQDINVQDTAYAPAGDMFELGAKVQVVKKGVFFPTRANKLYELYIHHNSLDEISEKTKKQIQEKYFKRSFDVVWQETADYLRKKNPKKLVAVEQNPKQKMAMMFRWYFVHTTRLAQRGSGEQKVDYQIHTGPSLGAFNQWVKGTQYESWRQRHVADIGKLLISHTADTLTKRFSLMLSQTH